MSLIKKRKADGSPYKDEGSPSKRLKDTTLTHIQPIMPEPAKKPSPRPSSEPSLATGSTSEIEVETNGHTRKAFQDLGIIQSLCDACTALGYKVHISSYFWSQLIAETLRPRLRSKLKQYLWLCMVETLLGWQRQAVAKRLRSHFQFYRVSL